ncbi:hypothetical protein RCL1_002820 [Eukaryota sp. TZLM3-RCL]
MSDTNTNQAPATVITGPQGSVSDHVSPLETVPVGSDPSPPNPPARSVSPQQTPPVKSDSSQQTPPTEKFPSQQVINAH